VGNSASIGDVVLGIRIDDAALNAGLQAARARIEGAAPVVLPAPRFATGAPPPPPPIQLPQFNPAELERIRIAQGLTAQSTRGIGVAAQAAQPGLRGLQSSLGGAAQGAVEVVASQAGLPPALAALGVGASGAVALGAGLAVAAGFSVAAANEMETLKKQLTLVTGGAGAADAAFKQLQQYAQISPFETTEVVNAGKQLAAFGFTTAQAVEFTERLGDVSVATGSDLGGLILNLGQIQSRGFANLVDINQFLQRGIPLWDLLTQATGKTRAELQALEGGIPADAILSAFRLLTDAGGAYFQASETGVTALDREWASLIDTVKLAAIPLGELLAPAVVNSITFIADTVKAWGQAFEFVGSTASKLSSNPLIATLFGIGGRGLAAIDQLSTRKLLPKIIGALGGDVAPSAASTAIPDTATDAAKLRAQDDNRKAQAARQAAEQEKQRKKEEDAQLKAAKRQADFIEQSRLAKIRERKEAEALGQSLDQVQGIAGVSPQTIAQVQSIVATWEFGGNRVAETLVKGASDAASKLIQANDKLRSAERGIFDLLNDQQQRELKQDAIERIQQNLPQGADINRINETLGANILGAGSETLFAIEQALAAVDPAEALRGLRQTGHNFRRTARTAGCDK
jgi:tape measure domain-containing protein